jgi:hypothetical protein
VPINLFNAALPYTSGASASLARIIITAMRMAEEIHHYVEEKQTTKYLVLHFLH